MIIKPKELIEIEKLLEEIRKYNKIEEWDDNAPQDAVFFANRPHLLMPLGYDEFRAMEMNKLDDDTIIPYIPFIALTSQYESFYRDKNSGSWYWLDGITSFTYPEISSDISTQDELYVHFKGPQEHENRFAAVSAWFEMLQLLCLTPDPNPHTLVLPSIWTPRIQLVQNLALATVAPELLMAISAEKVALGEIPWRRLEEIVAELLRAAGLQVSVTPRSRDGGRDIVARGELIPGEPTLIAVEVKQKPVVGISDVQRALRANEDFPALMIATAGRFSAGVIKEKERNRNQLRLFLKDGIALRQWIDAYRLNIS